MVELSSTVAIHEGKREKVLAAVAMVVSAVEAQLVVEVAGFLARLVHMKCKLLAPLKLRMRLR